MFHATPWSWWRRRARRPRPDRTVRASGEHAATGPAQCTGDLAVVADLLITWLAVDVGEVVLDLTVLSVALLALSDQLAAEDRERGGDTVWARDATAAAGYARAAREAATRPGRGLLGTLTALAAGLTALHARLAVRAAEGSEVPRR